jgi:hypothetical protein
MFSKREVIFFHYTIVEFICCSTLRAFSRTTYSMKVAGPIHSFFSHTMQYYKITVHVVVAPKIVRFVPSLNRVLF